MRKIVITLVIFCFMISSLNAQEALFDVKNDSGVSIFTVYPGGIKIMGMSLNADDSKIWIDDAEGQQLFVASQDSVRFYLYEDPGPTDESRGGFAIATVGSTSDELGSSFMNLTPDNYFIGHEAGSSIADGLYNTFIGYTSGANTSGTGSTGSNNLFIGYESGYSNTHGVNNVFIGYQSGKENIGLGSYNGDHNVFIGYQSGMNNNIDGESGQSNVFIGKLCGKYNRSGRWNVFLGTETGMYNETGYFNTYIGSQAGKGNITGDGNYNTFIGYMSGHKDSGSYNTYLGFRSAFEHLSGENNTIVGVESFHDNTSGNRNTSLGHGAGSNNVSGSDNVFIGYMAAKDEAGSNKLYIENTDSATPLIYGEFDNDILNFNATVGIGSSLPNSKLSLSGTTDTNGITLGDDQTTPILLYHTTNALRVTAPNSRIQYGTAEYIQDGGSFETSFNSDLCPVTDNYYDLGTSGYRWDDVYATNGTIITSDERDKDNIVPIQYGLTDIMQLNPVSFNWKGKDLKDRKLGLIAQELMKIVPEVVKTHDEKVIDEKTGEKQTVELDRLGVYYSDLIPVLIKGMQEQQKLIEELNGISKDQQKTIDSLNDKIGKLEEIINN